MKVELLRNGDAELWDFFEACPHSVAQQTPGWRAVIEELGEDEPLFLGCRDAGRLLGVLPGYRFEGPLGALLVSSAQAGPLGGVAAHPAADRDRVYAALLGAFVELAAARGCALASVISNPFWPDRELCAHHLKPDYVLENRCQVLDLASGLDADGLPRQVGGNLRRNLRRALSGALTVDEEQSEANLETWYAIHAARHRELGATPLPEQLFRGALRHMVPRERARFFFVRLAESGEMVAGGCYLHHGAVVDALMPSLRSEYARLAPNYLLALHSIRWAARRGLRYYNWQGSPPEGGVARFKQQWGSRDLGYAYLTRVTGDASAFLASTPAEVAAAYRWHYALPYDRIGAASTSSGASSRDAAWAAAQRTPLQPDPVVAHYETALARHGPSARGMDWKDEASQRLRFAVLCGVCDLRGKRVHEVGAGVGHLHDFLREQGIDADYSGSDLSAAMVEAARRRLPGVRFEQRDVCALAPETAHDVVLGSGLFHVSLGRPEDEWRGFVERSLRRMYAACRSAIAFNLMSDRVDFRSPDLYYASPGAMLDFCRDALSRFVVLRHDYPLHEFTIYVYREPPRGAEGEEPR